MSQPAWMRRLKVGHVIAERSGSWRVVRRVWRKNDGRLGGVSLAIKRCSWTHRCYTVLTASDLMTRGFRRIPAGPRRLSGKLDKKIHAAIEQGGCSRSELILTCCDVEGMA